MKKIILLFLLVFSTSLLSAREWTATSGHTLTGDFVELKDGNVAIKLPDGNIFDVPLDKLSEADQEFVKQESEKKDNPFIIREAEEKENPFVIQDAKPIAEKLPENEPTNQSSFGNGMSLETLQAEAEKNNPEALGWLCIHYMYGLNGCKSDKIKAEEYCVKSSKFAYTGSAVTQFCVGMCFLNGKEVEKSETEGVEWFRKSAEQGFAPAQERLALCYAKGFGIKEDRKAAFEWYQKAALQGFAPAEFGLAIFYNDGVAVERSEKEAAKWLRQSAEHGFVPAYELYAYFLFQGIGEPKDEAKAMEWYRKAVEQEDAESLDTVELSEENKREEAEPTQVRSPIQELMDESPEVDEQTNRRQQSENTEQVRSEPSVQQRQQQNSGSRQVNPNNVRRRVQQGVEIYNTIRRFL